MAILNSGCQCQIPTQTYLFDCLIKGLLLLLLLLLFACCVELLLLSVTDLVGGCGGGPRFLVFNSAALDVGVVFADAGFFLFFIIKCRDSSVLKSTAVPLLGAFVVFCGLFPVDDAADDGDSFDVGDVTPMAKAHTKTKIWQLKIMKRKGQGQVNNIVNKYTYIVHRLALTLA